MRTPKTHRARQAPTESDPHRPASTDVEFAGLLDDAGGREDKLQFRRHSETAQAFEFLEAPLLESVREAGVAEFAKERYGGGRYRVTHKLANGRFGKTVYFSVAGEPKPWPREQTAPATAERTAPSPIAAASSDAELLGLLRQRMVAQLLEPKPAFDWKSLVPLIAALSPIVSELIKGRSGEKSTIELAKEIAELAASKSAPSETRSAMAVLKDALEIKNLLGDGGGPAAPDPVGSVVAALAPELVGAMREARADDKARRAAAGDGKIAGHIAPGSLPPAPNSPGGNGVSVPGVAPAADELPAWALQLRPHIGQLVRVAQSGREPRGFATSILDYFLPDAHKGVLRELVAAEDCEQLLVTHFPELGAYGTWLAEFVDECRIYFFGEAPEASSGDGEREAAS